MRLQVALAIGLLLLAGCSSFKRTVIRPDKNPPTLRQRPNFSGPHYSVPTSCIQRVEWYQGWCEDDAQVPGQLICHDVVVKAPQSCIVVSAK